MGVGSGLGSLYALSYPPPPRCTHSTLCTLCTTAVASGTREFHSVLLSPILCEEKGLTKTQGRIGGGGAQPPPPPWTPQPPLKHNSALPHARYL